MNNRENTKGKGSTNTAGGERAARPSTPIAPSARLSAFGTGPSGGNKYCWWNGFTTEDHPAEQAYVSFPEAGLSSSMARHPGFQWWWPPAPHHKRSRPVLFER